MTFIKKITALEDQPHWIKQGEHFAYNPASMTKSRLGFKYLEVFSDPNADISKFKAPEGYSLVEIKVKGKFPKKWVYRAKLKQQTVTGQTNIDFSEFDKLFEDRYAFLKKVLATEDFPPDFVEWLTRFVDGSTYNYPDEAQGYKAEYAKFLEPFKPKETSTLYRGLTWGDGSGIEPWFQKSLELTKIPKAGDKVPHNRKRPTSWSKDFNLAKSFTTGGGLVLELHATPDMMLMDMEEMKKSLCGDDDPKWKNMCDYTTEKEQEITLLPGKYQATIKFVTPNAWLETTE